MLNVEGLACEEDLGKGRVNFLFLCHSGSQLIYRLRTNLCLCRPSTFCCANLEDPLLNQQSLTVLLPMKYQILAFLSALHISIVHAENLKVHHVHMKRQPSGAYVAFLITIPFTDDSVRSHLQE